jgi:uncharacterized protein YndB with AHSA1/START domain
MKILKILGIVSGVLAIVVLLGLIFLPEEASLQRSIVITAPVEKVYQELVTYKSFNQWSPWYEKDANAQYVYEGPESGVGASVSWTSAEVGNGSQQIIAAEENKRVRQELRFEGFDDPSFSEFILEEVEGGTQVTWTYEGEMKGFYKLMGLMMESFLGPDYERGLEKLKAYVEALPNPVVMEEEEAEEEDFEE